MDIDSQLVLMKTVPKKPFCSLWWKWEHCSLIKLVYWETKVTVLNVQTMQTWCSSSSSAPGKTSLMKMCKEEVLYGLNTLEVPPRERLCEPEWLDKNSIPTDQHKRLSRHCVYTPLSTNTLLLMQKQDKTLNSFNFKVSTRPWWIILAKLLKVIGSKKTWELLGKKEVLVL